MNKKVTIREVAEQANVSISTVHQALSGKSGVSEATRERIRAIAAELGYHPNKNASGLKRKTRHIAVFLPSEEGLNRYYYAPIWRGIRDYMASNTDMNVECVEITYPTENDAMYSEGAAYLRELIEQGRVDGILAMGHMDAIADEEWERYHQQGISVVLIGSDRPRSHRICCVQPDYDVIGRIMAEMILGRIPSFGSIVITSGNPQWIPHTRIVKGFEDYMREQRAENVVYKVNSWDMSEESYQKVLNNISRGDVAACCSVLARGSMLLGRALLETGKAGRVFAIGSDLFDESVKLLRDGVLNNLVEKAPYAQGYLGARYLVENMLLGKLPEREAIYVGSQMVFRSGLKVYEQDTYRAQAL